jgi:hypothetical protein
MVDLAPTVNRSYWQYENSGWSTKIPENGRAVADMGACCDPSSGSLRDEGKIMMKRSYLFALLIALLYGSVANAQYPVVDAIANKVAQKYQTSSCEQL